jgi:SAM-dependent methyltransferase
MSREMREQNRRSWNEATRAHNSHKVDQARFLREGGSSLREEEIELLGSIAGLRLLHLQCNAGQDTLSLARLGASVTGVDISDEAIGFARKLSADSGIPGEFERADVYDWLAGAAESERRFDVAFVSYGAICWLSDLKRWAAGIAAVLAPGGRFVLVEFHPVAMMFDEEWRARFPYSSGEPMREEDGVHDYVAESGGEALAPSGYENGVESFRNPEACYEFFWSPADVIQALVDAGLTLERFSEYPYSNGFRAWNDMRELPGGRFAPPATVPSMPLMYGIVARRAIAPTGG